MKMQNRRLHRSRTVTLALYKIHKTTRTVCNQPQANLLKNISKAKITKNTILHNNLHILYTLKIPPCNQPSLNEIFQSDCGERIVA